VNNPKIVSIIIPTLNEEKGVAKVIDEIPRKELERMGYKHEILIVDGASTDRTREIACKNGAKVVVEPQLGYGRAYKTGFANARGHIIVTLDGDSSYPAFLIPKLIRLLDEQSLDFISTNRMRDFARGSLSTLHVIGNKMLTHFAKFLFGINLNDSQSGMWIFKRNILEKVNLSANGMAFSEEIKVFAFRHLRSYEVPIPYRKRMGKQKLRTLIDGVGNLTYLFTLRFSLSGFGPSELSRSKYVRSNKNSPFWGNDRHTAILFSTLQARKNMLF
jgi:glycosyltransferase involved in cell wall biosynthesis